MRRILLTGANGQVGWELRRTLVALGDVVVADRDRLDLADLASIRPMLGELKPDVIVNAAAYTAVDKAESEPELARAVNATAPGVLAEEARRLGALLVHYSTDYVFDGEKPSPYVEDDSPNPLSVYGATKLAGENAIHQVAPPHLILRTSWVYGLRGKNFLLTIQRLAEERNELQIVDDQIGAPTWSRAIAEATAQMLARCASHSKTAEREAWSEVSGVYHVTAAGSASWYEFAEAIVEATRARRGGHVNVRPIPASQYPTPARRPRNSRLSSAKLETAFGLALVDWRAQLALCLATPD